MKATLPLLGLAVLFGCSPDVGPANPEDQVKVLSNPVDKPSDLLPISAGNAWTYSLRTTERNNQGQSGQATGNPTLKVTSQNGANATLTLLQENKPISELMLTTTASGVSQRAIKAVNGPTRSYSPAIPLFYWPMKPGEKKEWKGQGYRSALGDVGPMTSNVEYKGESEVDTPAGRMKAHRFDMVSTYKKGDLELGTSQTLWLVPKVGIVRSVEVTAAGTTMRETEMKLESYTVK